MAHRPVLLNEVIELLDPRPGEFIIDGTVDGGGHAAAIIQKIMPHGIFLGLDWDERLLAECKARLGDESGVILEHGNYADIPAVLEEKKLPKADGLLVDLGFSSEQLEGSGRGFSFKQEFAGEPLLMTYDDAKAPVKQIIRELKEEELANVIYEFGGERGSRRIAKTIKEALRKKKIETSGELAEVVRGALPKNYERGRIDPATRTFQALRIYANGELENLAKLLGELKDIVRPGGRVAIITFHSLEDGIVKRAFQSMAKESILHILTKKPVAASREEIAENPRSRSAKVRAAEITA